MTMTNAANAATTIHETKQVAWIYREGDRSERFCASSWDEAREIAREIAREGDYGSIEETIYVSCWIRNEDEDSEEERLTVEVDPQEPPCVDGRSHSWTRPHEVVGGLADNPGVACKGGGVVITEICERCGRYRVSDTWAQDADTGIQGLDAVRYREPDETSLLYVQQRDEE